MLYRADKQVKVIKENDHALDALRYVVNNLERMISRQEVKEISGVKYKKTTYGI